MLSIFLITQLLIVHFVADFLLQSDWMALNKSKGIWPLAAHIGVYTAFLMLFFPLAFCLLNGALHAATDAASSRATSWLWKRDERHWFFVVIGLDQLIHTATLFLTYYALYVHWGLTLG